MDAKELAAAIIHDLKNQLQSVLLEGEQVLNSIPQEHHEALQPLLSRTRRVHQDSMQLVTLYRLKERGNFSSEDAWPADTVRHALECLEVHYADLAINVDIDPACQGYYNAFLMQMALTNVMTNSAQAGASEITIRAHEEGTGLIIQIEDNGPGFSEGYLRGDVDSEKVGGTGLGLYFTDLIIKHHSSTSHPAEMRLENLASGGACVTLMLP